MEKTTIVENERDRKWNLHNYVPIKVHILTSCSAKPKQVLRFFRIGNTNREDNDISPHFSHDRKTKGYDINRR